METWNHFICTNSKYYSIVDMIEKRFLKSQFVEKTRHWYLFYGICLNKSCPQNLMKLVLQRFFKLAGSTYSQPHFNIQLNDCIPSRLVELLYWKIAALKSVRKVLGRQLHYWWTEFIIGISEILRCFGQWLFNLMDMHFSKKVFWQSNTSVDTCYCFTTLAFTIYLINSVFWNQ